MTELEEGKEALLDALDDRSLAFVFRLEPDETSDCYRLFAEVTANSMILWKFVATQEIRCCVDPKFRNEFVTRLIRHLTADTILFLAGRIPNRPCWGILKP